jgi:hypothetical protein
MTKLDVILVWLLLLVTIIWIGVILYGAYWIISAII